MSLNISTRLFLHETGRLGTLKLKNDICWARVSKLELSRFRDIRVRPENESDNEEGDEEQPRGHSSAVTALNVDSQEGRYLLAGCSDGSLYIHDLADFAGEPRCSSRLISHVKSIPAPQEPAPAARAFSTSRNRTPARPQAEVKDGHFQSVQTVQWFPEDSALFVTSGMDQRLLVWDANTMKIAEEFKINKLVFCHHLSRPPSTMVAVASSSNHLRLIDLKSGSSTHELRGHSGTNTIK